MRTATTALLFLALTNCSHSKSGDPTPTPCTAETDAAFCARLSACENLTAGDNCGTSRSVACGSCSNAAHACVSNICQAPACSTLSFSTTSTVVTSLSSSSAQDALAASTGSAGTLFFQRRSSCAGSFSLLVADPTGPGALTYTALDVPLTTLGAIRADAEPFLAMLPDGNTLVGVSTDGSQLLATTRSGPGTNNFGTPISTAALANVTATAPATLSFPVISPDGLALYYDVGGSTVASENGIYESVRATMSVAFPAGAKMPAAVQLYQNVSGISSDRMTLFLQTSSFATEALTRRSTLDPFTNPNGTGAAPSIPGFRTRPVADCSAVLGTCTVGGCPGEDTCRWPRL